YLSGFVYEALSEPGLAAPGYRKAIELRPESPMLEQALLDLDTSDKRDTEESDVLLIVQTGLAPARNSIRIPLPIPTSNGLIIAPLSFPVIEADQSTAPHGPININAQAFTLTQLNNTTQMSKRALLDDMPVIFLRTSIRAATRSLAQKQLNDV